MSVDIEELAAHLDKQRREDIKKQYGERATNATAAFLLCFFLGFLGAHRFYLRQLGVGFAHLVLFALGVAGFVAGFLTASPLNAAFFVIGGVFILACLIWEIVDLGRIDDEIHRRNLLLAEGLIAGALLSDSTVIEDAVSKLGETVHTAADQSRAAGGAHDTSAFSAGMISVEDLAQARALAEESGMAAISYQEISDFTVSATPDERTDSEQAQAQEPTTITEREVSVEALSASQDTPSTIVAQTQTHSEDGYRVTDAEETDRVSGPSAAEALGIGASALGVAEVSLGMSEATSTQEAPVSELASDVAPEAAMASESELVTIEPVTTPEPEPAGALEPETLSKSEVAPASFASLDETRLVEPAAAVLLQAEGDVTDAGAPSFYELAADVAFASSYPGYIALPEDASSTEPAITRESYAELPASSAAPDAVTEPDVPLYIAPEVVASHDALPATPEPLAESYVPPVPDVYSASAPQPEMYTPSWETPSSTLATPAPAPELVAPPSTQEPSPKPSQAPETLAELAELGVTAGASSLAIDMFGEHAAKSESEFTASPEPMAAEPAVEPATAELASTEAATEPVATEPAAPKMKRIRVKHRIVVEGQVVREEMVEREVPADMDMAVAARQIQAELEQAAATTPDEIARLANLSADETVEVRRHVEGLE